MTGGGEDPSTAHRMTESVMQHMIHALDVESAVPRCFDRTHMSCLCCGATPELGALCRACALEIEPCDGLIPDHIHSRVDTSDAGAWILDGFGGAHAVGATSCIGRNHECDLVVLASSV